MAKIEFTIEEFMCFVSPEPNTGCWLWTGNEVSGYAHISKYFSIQRPGSFRKGFTRGDYAHRVSYELFRRRIPPGLEIDHLCEVRFCVNPWHLEPVTRSLNSRRGNNHAKWESRTHCPSGHEMTEENTCFVEGQKECWKCRKAQLSNILKSNLRMDRMALRKNNNHETIPSCRISSLPSCI